MKLPSYEIPLSEKDLNEEQLEALSKLGFKLGQELARFRRYVYLKLPETSPFLGFIRKNTEGRYEYFVTHEGTELLSVFLCVNEIDMSKTTLRLTLNSKAIETASRSIPKTAVQPVKLNEYQQKIAELIRSLSRSAFSNNALFGEGKLALSAVETLCELASENPAEHKQAIKSNRMFSRAYALFPGWHDHFNYAGQLERLDAGVSFANHAHNISLAANPELDLLVTMMSVNPRKSFLLLSQLSLDLNEKKLAKLEITPKTIKAIIKNALSFNTTIKQSVDQTCMLLTRKLKTTPKLVLQEMFPVTITNKGQKLDLSPYNSFVCGYFCCLQKNWQEGNRFLKLAKTALKGWRANDKAPGLMTNYLEKQIERYLSFTDKKLGIKEPLTPTEGVTQEM